MRRQEIRRQEPTHLLLVVQIEVLLLLLSIYGRCDGCRGMQIRWTASCAAVGIHLMLLLLFVMVESLTVLLRQGVRGGRVASRFLVPVNLLRRFTIRRHYSAHLRSTTGVASGGGRHQRNICRESGKRRRVKSMLQEKLMARKRQEKQRKKNGGLNEMRRRQRKFRP